MTICKNCVMDNSNDLKNFNSDGVCNYCVDFLKKEETLFSIKSSHLKILIESNLKF